MKILSLYPLFLMFFLLPYFLAINVSNTEDDNVFSPPLEIDLQIDQTSLNLGDSVKATLSINNTTTYSITHLGVWVNSAGYSIVDNTTQPNAIAPFDSFQVEYVLKSQKTGSQKVVFSIEYSWIDQESVFYRRVETVSSDDVNVSGWFGLDWPEYLIPVFIGFFIGQLGVYFNERRKNRSEAKMQEEQVTGILLAVLQSARKGLEEMEQVSYVAVWEKAIVAGNLYPAIHRVGRSIGTPDLSRRLAELSVLITDYNDKCEKENLTEDFVLELKNEIEDLTNIIIKGNSK